MKLQIEINESQLRDIVLRYVEGLLSPDRAGFLYPEDIQIEVKSQQNYKSEWERAAFRARIDKTID